MPISKVANILALRWDCEKRPSTGPFVKEITFFLEPGASAEADWRHHAACREITDPDIFFPIGNTGPALDQIEAAKEICLPCPVRRECLEWAMSTRQDAGVWGGLSEDERRMLRRSQGQKVLS